MPSYNVRTNPPNSNQFPSLAQPSAPSTTPLLRLSHFKPHPSSTPPTTTLPRRHEGSANDARVLENAERHDFSSLPGRVWLADAGYGLRPGILTPYRGVGYHLREQAQPGLRPKANEGSLSLRCAQLRGAVGRVFGVFGHILETAPEFDIATQAKLVLVLAALRNLSSTERIEMTIASINMLAEYGKRGFNPVY